MENISKFKEVIEEMIRFFEELTELEQGKLQAVTDNNLKALEDFMAKEQVGIMRLRVLEKRRDEIQTKLGLQGLAFRDIIEKLEGDDKEELILRYHKLADVLMHFNLVADSAKTAIETNLYSIEAILKRLKEKNGTQSAKEGGFSSKRA